MDKDRHSLRRPYQSNTRRPLGTSQRSHGSSSQGMGNSRGHRAGAPTEHTRRSHLFPPPDSRTASSISGSSSIHDFGDYGYAQASGYTPPQMLGYPSTYQANSLPLTYNNAQPSQYSQQLYHPTRGFEQAQENLNAPSAYQHTLSTSAGASSSLLDGQPYHNLGPLQPSLTHGQALANPYIQSLTSSNDEYAQYGSTSMPESSHTQAPSLSLEQPALENVFGQEPQSELNRNRLATFDRLMRRTNTDTLDGRLKEARSSLIRLSRWLQENVGSLEGLTRDVVVEDKEEWRKAHKSRLDLWQDFNHCWLAFLQRQYDDTISGRRSKSSRLKDTNVLSFDMLEEVGDEVVRINDRLEGYGLVDYQMGFWESEILDLLEKCEKALDPDRFARLAGTR